jgi:hypothetical protein
MAEQLDKFRSNISSEQQSILSQLSLAKAAEMKAATERDLLKKQLGIFFPLSLLSFFHSLIFFFRR